MGHELLTLLVAIHIAVCKNKASYPHTQTEKKPQLFGRN
jgi:hypothetical protein